MLSASRHSALGMVDFKPSRQDAARDIASLPREEPELKEITARRAHDRQWHIERGLEAGLSREEAEAHAEADLRDRDEGERTPPAG